MKTSAKIKETIKKVYAAAALSVKNDSNKHASCCSQGSFCCTGSYAANELEPLPKEAWKASLGCGNPTALVALNKGDIVLDLGSGGGIDVLLSAKRVGPEGKVYGLDMTDEMMELAHANLLASELTNVELLKGDIEQIPLPNNHVNVIISNCVINLATNKDNVLREAFRVLKPGGHLAISDIMFQGDKNLIPNDVLQQAEQWAGCVAGALTEEEYCLKLADAKFTNVSIQVIQVYDKQIAQQWLGLTSWPEGRVRVVSAFIRACKPQ